MINTVMTDLYPQKWKRKKQCGNEQLQKSWRLSSRGKKKKVEISSDFMSYIILLVAFGNFQTILG